MIVVMFGTKKNTLILFDVDGTLTEAREPIDKKVLKALGHLAKVAEIGFLTGSELSYIKEQLWPVFNVPLIKKNCHVLPCNGTEYMIPVGDEDLQFHTISKVNMRGEIGDLAHQQLMRVLCRLQGEIANKEFRIPLNGHFVQNRGSMVNWCPIGRNAKPPQRKIFEALDKSYRIREKYIEILRDMLKELDIELTVKLGGNTSFDIYPPGWDKTFALTHFNSQEWDFWFVGDRCSPDGNDYEIFTKLKHTGQAFETSGPAETIDIIDFHILRDLGD